MSSGSRAPIKPSVTEWEVQGSVHILSPMLFPAEAIHPVWGNGWAATCDPTMPVARQRAEEWACAVVQPPAWTLPRRASVVIPLANMITEFERCGAWLLERAAWLDTGEDRNCTHAHAHPTPIPRRPRRHERRAGRWKDGRWFPEDYPNDLCRDHNPDSHEPLRNPPGSLPYLWCPYEQCPEDRHEDYLQPDTPSTFGAIVALKNIGMRSVERWLYSLVQHAMTGCPIQPAMFTVQILVTEYEVRQLPIERVTRESRSLPASPDPVPAEPDLAESDPAESNLWAVRDTAELETIVEEAEEEGGPTFHNVVMR